MDEKIKEALLIRNERIIKAVIEKSKRVCPDSVALVGIYGSFATGDIHDKSDLDLFIVIDDSKGYRIGSCFILGDVAHDIYCTTWQQVEEMAKYSTPYISRLMDLNIVYYRYDKQLQRFMELRGEAEKRLSSPLNERDLSSILTHFEHAQKSLADLVISEEYCVVKYESAKLINSIEMIMYLINKSYVSLGSRHIPEEIERMRELPIGFLDHYRSLIEADALSSIKKNATSLMRCTKEKIEEIKYRVKGKKKLDSQGLTGSYEEIYSNWRNKMELAAKTGNKYLSLMTAASCQRFYDEMREEYEGVSIDLMKHFDINDLQRSARMFDEAMEEYRLLYDVNSVKVKKYRTIEEFEEDYLR
ncbi:MAG TPA: nucleotidyltransferase domain-containing protein [Mesotoga infera]|uniref:Nucleotidyltransferase domain-containing protein n=1 Tax=Mesotoga infera TaxID=1236046 RepID=A0A7C1GSQ1_9BACT|nr:nucleotidyltransferase domain-containing protein [Mesotoga infera]